MTSTFLFITNNIKYYLKNIDFQKKKIDLKDSDFEIKSGSQRQIPCWLNKNNLPKSAIR